MMKRRVIIADTLGFCFGVRRALEQVEKAVETLHPGEGRVLTYGPLIHNSTVLRELAEEGVVCVDSVEDVRPDDTVVIRAHGVPGEVKRKLDASGAAVIDGTCPRVLKSERLVAEYDRKGYRVVISGDFSHGEVTAVSSHGKDVLVVDSVEAAASVQPDRPLLLLSQTTFSLKLFEEISDILKEACAREGVPFVRFNTVCPATGSRQKALEKLCGEVDAVLVIGGKSSANTRRLYDSARECMEAVWHIEEASEIREEMVRFPVLGITAGASTPDGIISEVVAEVERLQALEGV